MSPSSCWQQSFHQCLIQMWGKKILQNETSCCPYRWGSCSLSQTAQRPVPTTSPSLGCLHGWGVDGHCGKELIYAYPYYWIPPIFEELLKVNFFLITCFLGPRSLRKPLRMSFSGVKLVQCPVFECVWERKAFYYGNCPGVPFGLMSLFVLVLRSSISVLTCVARWIECGLRNKGSPVRFPARAHSWVAGQVPTTGPSRSNHTLIFLSLSFPLSSLLSKN